MAARMSVREGVGGIVVVVVVGSKGMSEGWVFGVELEFELELGFEVDVDIAGCEVNV